MREQRLGNSNFFMRSEIRLVTSLETSIIAARNIDAVWQTINFIKENIFCRKQ